MKALINRLRNERLVLAVMTCLLGLVVGGALYRALVYGGDGPPDPAWQHIQRQGRLVVAIDPSYPPFASYGDPHPTGLDADLALALGRELGLDVHFSWQGYDGLYDSLMLGQTDLIISAIRPDPLRTDHIYYTTPYIDAGQVFVMQASAAPPDPASLGFSTLSGQSLAVELATEGDLAARRYLEAHPAVFFDLQRHISAQAALTAVIEGQADAALVDRISAGEVAAQTNVPLTISPPVVPDPHVIAIRRDNWQLIRHVEDALTELRRSGQLAALTRQWIDGKSLAQPK